ncbi:NAD-dependent epimerase/dehydratase family protein [Nitrosopumilus sp.]|uniref:NAD-dependent epimerase/dehydratase family protein n=1 Tax=Nitrosopumilus sp. TaxID=2024843 RepID=UPI0026021168|nr:NAD-dependent epimerase/dehydratase family protein [Nitrosopumilus sp.]
MKFAVTGGSGFIGSYIVKHLLNQGHQVTIIDNYSRGRLENLQGYENKINSIKIDILEFNRLREAIDGHDGIFHQAALTSVPESFTHQEKYHKVNVDGTENIFKIAQEFKNKVVYASSSSVYGDTISIPIKENFEKNPINPYGKTKLDDERLAEKYSKSGVRIIGLRYFNVYGIGQTLDYAGVITKFHDLIKENLSPIIFGDGSQIRDFISVEDVAKANLFAMQSKTNFDFLNIGTGIGTSILELANLMIKLSGKSLSPKIEEPLEGDIKESQADVIHTKKSIGWSYETELENGLKKFFFS